jgi:hypothetical protein
VHITKALKLLCFVRFCAENEHFGVILDCTKNTQNRQIAHFLIER